MAFTTTSSIKTFGGTLLKLTHASTATGTPMALNLFLPASSSAAAAPVPVPVLIYLSGLTCSPDNCAEKGFLHAAAATRSLAIIYPDTSPRGLSPAAILDLRDDWAFGEAAGFYVDATRAPYADNFRMETYLVDELPRLLWGEGDKEGEGQFRDRLDGGRVSICGHSMGGHGALALYLRHPGLYRSVSAWAPVANPVNCPWGKRAFGGYFGEGDAEVEEWKRHDATELVGGWKGALNCLIDVGKADKFYQQGQLLPENFEAAAKAAGLDGGLTVRYHDGYDHSYYFISSFAADHVAHAAQFLKP